MSIPIMSICKYNNDDNTHKLPSIQGSPINQRISLLFLNLIKKNINLPNNYSRISVMKIEFTQLGEFL